MKKKKKKYITAAILTLTVKHQHPNSKNITGRNNTILHTLQNKNGLQNKNALQKKKHFKTKKHTHIH